MNISTRPLAQLNLTGLILMLIRILGGWGVFGTVSDAMVRVLCRFVPGLRERIARMMAGARQPGAAGGPVSAERLRKSGAVPVSASWPGTVVRLMVQPAAGSVGVPLADAAMATAARVACPASGQVTITLRLLGRVANAPTTAVVRPARSLGAWELSLVARLVRPVLAERGRFLQKRVLMVMQTHGHFVTIS